MNIIKRAINKLRKKALGNNFPFDKEKFKVLNINDNSLFPNINDIVVRGKFTVNNIVYYVLWGTKDSSGDWRLVTLTNSADGQEYDFMYVHGYRLYQMKRFGIKLEIIEKPLLEIVNELWENGNNPVRAKNTFALKQYDFMRFSTTF